MLGYNVETVDDVEIRNAQISIVGDGFNAFVVHR